MEFKADMETNLIFEDTYRLRPKHPTSIELFVWLSLTQVQIYLFQNLITV